MRGSGSLARRTFAVLNVTFLLLFSLSCLYPFYYVVSYSLSDPLQASMGNAALFPVGLNVNTYRAILADQDIYRAIIISTLRTVIGAALTVVFSSFLAYLLTKRKLGIRRILYRFLVITMYFNAGIIPYYVTMKTIGLKDSFLLYVIPSAVVAFFVILFKTYIEQVPPDCEESAMVDGAGFVRTFATVVFPLCLPIVAAVAVFAAVGQWNTWFDNMLLITNRRLDTLQYILYQYLAGAFAQSLASRENANLAQAGQSRAAALTPTSIQMTITVIAIIPISIVYPLMQRYFVKGIMVGAIKG